MTPVQIIAIVFAVLAVVGAAIGLGVWFVLSSPATPIAKPGNQAYILSGPIKKTLSGFSKPCDGVYTLNTDTKRYERDFGGIMHWLHLETNEEGGQDKEYITCMTTKPDETGNVMDENWGQRASNNVTFR